MRILVVDDDPIFRTELGELLSDEGHAIETAPSVPKALETLAAGEIDVVLTDLKMPRHSGLELLREVRAHWPRTLVVVVTGFASVETALEAMKNGAFDYVRKPFRIEQVRETLRLAAQEHEFETTGESIRDPLREATALAASGKYEVLLLGEAKDPHVDHLTVAPFDPDDPSGIVARVDEFADGRANAAVVVAGVERLLERHRLEDIVAMLERLRARLAGHGPLRVGFNPRRVGPSAAVALGSAVATEETHSTLEALANPIRRKILQRLGEGAATFGEAMHAAGLDDSPKMAFHLRRLLEAGLLVHEDETYRLTARGTASVRLLAEATFLPTGNDGGNRAFAGRRGAGGTAPRNEPG